VVGFRAEGEQGGVIVGGIVIPPGDTMLERKVYVERKLDHLRPMLICEPRGSVARHVAECRAGKGVWSRCAMFPPSPPTARGQQGRALSLR
jgi:proline racemase